MIRFQREGLADMGFSHQRVSSSPQDFNQKYPANTETVIFCHTHLEVFGLVLELIHRFATPTGIKGDFSACQKGLI